MKDKGKSLATILLANTMGLLIELGVEPDIIKQVILEAMEE